MSSSSIVRSTTALLRAVGAVGPITQATSDMPDARFRRNFDPPLQRCQCEPPSAARRFRVSQLASHKSASSRPRTRLSGAEDRGGSPTLALNCHASFLGPIPGTAVRAGRGGALVVPVHDPAHDLARMWQRTELIRPYRVGTWACGSSTRVAFDQTASRATHWLVGRRQSTALGLRVARMRSSLASSAGLMTCSSKPAARAAEMSLGAP